VITSPHNDKLKQVRRLARRRSREDAGRFVAEGEDLLAAAEAAGWPALERFVAAGSGLAGTEVDPDVLARVSALGSGTRALAVYEERWSTPVGPLCVCLWGVGDPGNVGAVLRSALAFGAASVALGPGCADPYGPKAVRASMGALFELSLARVEDVGDLPGSVIALDAHGGEPLKGPATGETTLLVGAERSGLPADVLERAGLVAHIPVHNESLNAAIAASVALYEMTRDAGAGVVESPTSGSDPAGARPAGANPAGANPAGPDPADGE
jgi:RNA methyltransferase, TrmH family